VIRRIPARNFLKFLDVSSKVPHNVGFPFVDSEVLIEMSFPAHPKEDESAASGT